MYLKKLLTEDIRISFTGKNFDLHAFTDIK